MKRKLAAQIAALLGEGQHKLTIDRYSDDAIAWRIVHAEAKKGNTITHEEALARIERSRISRGNMH